MEVLFLRLDAPLLSFGAPIVDGLGVIQPFPGLATLAGLLGNALGYDHRDVDRLSTLQRRLRYAVRCDRAPEKLTDFQTVDLGKEWMSQGGWTTSGLVDERGKGEATSGTHIRTRDYWADGVYTVVVALASPAESPTLSDLEAALSEPARPLFIGRKSCLPAAPLLLGKAATQNFQEALRVAPALPSARARSTGPLAAWWPDDPSEPASDMVIPVVDERDWANQIHVGRRLIRHGGVNPEEDRHA